MIKIWIIDDDKENIELYKQLFDEDRPDVQVKSFECLYDAFQCDSDVDYIFIDLSAVDGTIPRYGNHSYIGNLQKFADKNKSAFIVLISAIMSYAEADVEDLKNVCSDVSIFAIDAHGPKNYNAMVEFVNKYSPRKL